MPFPSGIRPSLPAPLSPVKKQGTLREWLIGLGWSYLALAWIAFLMGAIAIGSKYGLLELLSILSPFNLWSWGVTSLTFAPGIGLLVIGYRLSR